MSPKSSSPISDHISPPNTSTGKLIGLEYIRGIAALCVAASHFFMQTSGDELFEIASIVAVEIFFPLSGFVLGTQINFLIKHRYGYSIFLARRWMRTLPPYLVGLLAVTVLLGESIDKNILEYVFFFKYLSPEYSVGNYFPIAWSLAVEEWYYIVFPAFLLALSYFFPNPKHIVLITLGFVGLVFVAKLLSADFLSPSFLRIFSFFRLDAICLGYLFFLCFGRGNQFKVEILIWSTTLLFIIALILTQNIRTSPLSSALLFSMLPVFFSGIISSIGKLEMLEILTFRGLLRSLGLWLGRLSYPIYIFHLLVLYILSSYPSWNNFFYYLVILIIFCMLFNVLFERPIMAARPSYKLRPNVNS